MEGLGLIGGAGNQNKPGGVTIRSRPAETTAQRKKRKAEERSRKREALEVLKAQQAELRRKREAERAAASPDPSESEDPDPDSGSSEPDPIPAAKQRPKARATAGTPAAQLLASFAIPAGFDEIERVRQIASAPWIDPGKQLHACELLIKLKGGRGKVDWASVKLEQIPEDMRHRLAGQLVGWLDWAELPEVVRLAAPACRQVYRLTGVLPSKAEDAEVVLARWEVVRAELRELAGEVRQNLKPAADPLDLELAAETAYVQPQWEIDAGGN